MSWAPELAPFEPFSAQSQHLGWFDLTLVELDWRQALEDVDKDPESAIRVKPVNLATERRKRTVVDPHKLSLAKESPPASDGDVSVIDQPTHLEHQRWSEKRV